jgi:hypothetical protein
MLISREQSGSRRSPQGICHRRKRMEPFIQIMIADSDLRLLPVKAIARWPPDIRIHICALDNSLIACIFGDFIRHRCWHFSERPIHLVIASRRRSKSRITDPGDRELQKTRNSRVASRVPDHFLLF